MDHGKWKAKRASTIRLRGDSVTVEVPITVVVRKSSKRPSADFVEHVFDATIKCGSEVLQRTIETNGRRYRIDGHFHHLLGIKEVSDALDSAVDALKAGNH